MGNEYTVTCSYHGNVIYRGSSKSSYDYYRSGSRQCSQCHAEDARAAREAAEARARDRARDEIKRVKERQAELERLERERQREREAERRREREAEKQRILAARQRQEEERERLRQEMLAKSAEEINGKANEIKQQNEARRANNPFLHYKKLNTLETVKEISKEVNKVAVVGQIVTERVNAISNELEESLGDDYDIIKAEMNRYKNYGQEMSSMTDVFVEEFQKVFPNISSTNIEEMTEIHNMANESKDEEEKKDLKSEVNETLVQLNCAIKKVEAKLFLMEQYYDQMIIDYTYFKEFCSLKQDELESTSNTFKDLAELLKGVDRSVLEGTGDQQKMEFIEEYEYKVTCTEETGYKMKNAVITGAVVGGAVGGVGGGLVGYGLGGPVGAVAGAAVGAIGGAVVGAAVGALCALVNPYEYKVTSTTKKDHVVYKCKKSELITYSGEKQADALQRIVTNMTGSNAYQTLQRELESSRKDADDKLYECKRLKGDVQSIGTKMRNYKLEMKALTDKFETGNTVSDTQAKLIDRRLKSLSSEIRSIITTMK